MCKLPTGLVNKYVCLEYEIKEILKPNLTTPHINRLYNFYSPYIFGRSVKEGLKNIMCINVHIPSLFDRLV